MGSSDEEGVISWRHQMKALVVDSCDFFSLFIKIHLNAFGVETETVATGEAATELIYKGKMFDLIVVDAALDDATGIQITRQLRYMGVESKIVGLTLMYSEEEKMGFMEAGADEYIEKRYRFQNMFIPILAEIDNE